MRISDWSSDVCSSDLAALDAVCLGLVEPPVAGARPVRRRRFRIAELVPVDDTVGPGVPVGHDEVVPEQDRSEEHTSELQSLMRISYAAFCLEKIILVCRRMRSSIRCPQVYESA